MKAYLYFLILVVCAFSVIATIDVNTYSTTIDFSVSPGIENIKVCSCNSYNDKITVTNTGSFGAIFYVEGNIPLSETTFSLEPGQSKELWIYFYPDCEIKSKNIQIKIKSNLGVEKFVNKRISFDTCQNIELRLKADINRISACQPANYVLFVTNIGSFEEQYELSSNYDAYMTYTAKYFTLQPNQTAQVNASLLFTCDIYGDKDVVFSAHSVKNKLTAKINSKLSIDSDYGFEFFVNNDFSLNNSVRQSLEVCNKVYETRYPVVLANTGVANNFIVKADLPDFARIEGIDDNDMRIHLEKGESKTFFIVVDAHEFSDEAKGYDFSLSINSAIGNVKKERLLRINLKPCYDIKLNIIKDATEKVPEMLCSGLKYEYEIEISNKGLFTEYIKLNADGNPDTVFLERYNITLKPQESKKIRLLVQGPETDNFYNVKVIGALKNGLTYQDDIWFKTHTKNNCYAISADDKFNANYQTNYVEQTIKSTGLLAATYTVKTDSGLLIPGKSKINVSAAETKLKLWLNTSNLPPGTYKGVVTFANNKSGVSYDKEVFITLKDKSIFTKTFEFLFYGNECKQFSLYQFVAIILMIILIIIFLITSPHYPYKLQNRIKQKWGVAMILTIIFVIALAFVIIFVGFPKASTHVYNINTSLQDMRFEWVENEKYILDAKQFFDDPDKNTLRYEVSPMKNINAVVRDGNIYLIPDSGWFGKRNFTITAYDDFGGVIESPTMFAVVIEKPKTPLINYYNIYCWWVNLVLLLLILLLILMAFIVKQRKRYK